MSVEARFRQRLNDVSYYLWSLRSLEELHLKPGRSFYRASAAIAASRASAFIMIYNCVEFGVREAVVAVRTDIAATSPTYVELHTYWREEIVRAQFRDRLEQGGEYTRLLRDFAEFIPGRISWRNKLRELPFSGNIDHEALIAFARKIGETRWGPPKHSLGGSDLALIRTKRNELAHGEETFENVGAAYSTADIHEKLRRVRAFTCSFIQMLDRHMVRKKYRKN